MSIPIIIGESAMHNPETISTDRKNGHLVFNARDFRVPYLHPHMNPKVTFAQWDFAIANLTQMGQDQFFQSGVYGDTLIAYVGSLCDQNLWATE